MQKIVRLFLLVYVCSYGCKNSNKDALFPRLTGPQAEKDLTVFTDILKKEHPSLYLYISPAHFNSMIEEIRSSLTNGIGLQDLYN